MQTQQGKLDRLSDAHFTEDSSELWGRIRLPRSSAKKGGTGPPEVLASGSAGLCQGENFSRLWGHRNGRGPSPGSPLHMTPWVLGHFC